MTTPEDYPNPVDDDELEHPDSLDDGEPTSDDDLPEAS